MPVCLSRKLLEHGIHTSPLCSSTQDLGQGIYTFPCLFVGADSEVHTLSFVSTGFSVERVIHAFPLRFYRPYMRFRSCERDPETKTCISRIVTGRKSDSRIVRIDRFIGDSCGHSMLCEGIIKWDAFFGSKDCFFGSFQLLTIGHVCTPGKHCLSHCLATFSLLMNSIGSPSINATRTSLVLLLLMCCVFYLSTFVA